MKPSLISVLLILGVLGATMHLVGCRAQSSQASQESVLIVPAVADVSGTPVSQPNPSEPSGEAVAPATTNANEQAATLKSFGEKLQSGEARLSEGVAGVISLAQGGVGEDVLLAYVQNQPAPFRLSSEEILYLTDLGIPEAVIAAMIKHTGAAAILGQNAGTAMTNVVAVATNNASLPMAVMTNQIPTLPYAPSYAITATPEFEAGAQIAPAPYPTTDPNVQYFYSSLEPYGSWVDVPDYGICWQPTVAVVDSTWMPYTHRGNWIYSDCGWYWRSDYSWGWAPFHYGRWANYPHRGWLWVPDTTWGPAWVTWRYSDTHCGWAPLPPGARFDGAGFRFRSGRVGIGFDFGLGIDCYTFVPTSRFCDPNPWRHRLVGPQVVNVFNHTTIINRYVQGPNRLVINEGIDRQKIAAVSRSEIRKVTIREAPLKSTRPVRFDKLEKNGSELVVYRPRLAAASESLAAHKTFETRRSGNATLVNQAPGNSPAKLAGPPISTSLESPRRFDPNSQSASRSTEIGKANNPNAVAAGPQWSGQPRPRVNTFSGASVQNNDARPVETQINSSPINRNILVNQPAFKAANESQVVSGSGQPQVQPPVNPVQRRETTRPTMQRPIVVYNRGGEFINAPNSASSAATTDINSRSPALRPMNDLEARLAERQAAIRAATPSAQQPVNDPPLIRSRGLTQQFSSSPGFNSQIQNRYLVPNGPANGSEIRQSAIDSAPSRQFRQELQKPPGTIYRERPTFGQPAPYQNYQTRPGFSPQQSPSASPSRGYSETAPASRPYSSSGTISISPSSRQGPPPTQVQPSQMTPSTHSSSPAPSSSSSSSSRSGGSSNGRQQER